MISIIANVFSLIPIPFSVIASYMDLKTGKIKNYITYPLILIGILINFYFDGFRGIAASFIGVFFIIFFLSHKKVFKLGGGDIKLAMGYGVFLKGNRVLVFVFIFLILVMMKNVIYYIFRKGFRYLLIEIKYEIKSFGGYQVEFDKFAGGPLLLIAYVVTLLINL